MTTGLSPSSGKTTVALSSEISPNKQARLSCSNNTTGNNAVFKRDSSAVATSLVFSPARAAAREKSEGESVLPLSGKPARSDSRVVVMSWARATSNKHSSRSSPINGIALPVPDTDGSEASGKGVEVVIQDGSG